MTEFCQGPDPHPRKPRFAIPPGATDTHFHLFGDGKDSRFVPEREYTPPEIAPVMARHVFGTPIGRRHRSHLTLSPCREKPERRVPLGLRETG